MTEPAQGRLSALTTMGAVDGSLYLLGRVGAKLSAGRLRLVKYCVVAQPLGRPQPRPLRPDPHTHIDWVVAGDALCASFPRPPEVIERRFRSGARCLGAVVKGEFAGFIWLQTRRYEEDEVRCTYVLADPRAAVWDFDVYVAPKFRLGRTLARLWQAADERLAAEGFRWSISRISAFNPGSLATHRRLGTVEIDRLLFLRLGRHQLAFRRSAWGYRPMGLGPSPCSVEFAAPAPHG